MGVGNRALIVEFLGTFGLIFMGAGAIVMGQGGLVGIALAHGLAIFLGVSFSGHISGGHLNPAVTAAFLATKRMGANVGLAYMASQLLGGIVAAILLWVATRVRPGGSGKLGTPEPGPGVGWLELILIEAILTFFLVFVIFGTGVDPRSPAKAIFPLCIGMAVTMDILMGGPLTGAAMNPARAFGPALVSGVWTMHLGYWIGPILGGVAAALLYDNVLMEKK
jgi:MIP family channel proteins